MTRPRLFAAFVVVVSCTPAVPPERVASPVVVPTRAPAAEDAPAAGTTPAPQLPVAAGTGPAAFVTPSESEIKARGATRALSPRILPALKKRWSARVGRTTFRTTIGFAERMLVIGTHGAIACCVERSE